jgi:hypothetical protein
MDAGGGPGICPRSEVSEINKMKEIYKILPPTLIYFKCSSILTTKISKNCLNKFGINFLDSFLIGKSVSKFSAPPPPPNKRILATPMLLNLVAESELGWGSLYNHIYEALTLSHVREWEGMSHTPIPLGTFTKK